MSDQASEALPPEISPWSDNWAPGTLSDAPENPTPIEDAIYRLEHAMHWMWDSGKTGTARADACAIRDARAEMAELRTRAEKAERELDATKEKARRYDVMNTGTWVTVKAGEVAELRDELAKTREWCVRQEEKFQLVSEQRDTGYSDIAELRAKLAQVEGSLEEARRWGLAMRQELSEDTGMLYPEKHRPAPWEPQPPKQGAGAASDAVAEKQASMVACPTCGSGPQVHCRDRLDGSIADTHEARFAQAKQGAGDLHCDTCEEVLRGTTRKAGDQCDNGRCTGTMREAKQGAGDPVKWLECDCCGGDAAPFPVREGDPLRCGCSGAVTCDEDAAWASHEQTPCNACIAKQGAGEREGT